MNKKVDLILKLLTTMLLLISLIVAILSFNINKLGVISINNYSLVMPKAKENKKIKTNDLFITKKIGISQIKVNDEVAYIDIEDNKSIQKIGKVKSINITKTNTHIYNINNKRIDSSCIIGVYKYKIPFLAKIISILLTKKGFLLTTVLPLFIISIYRLIYLLLNINKN